jgi:hypothetical protein
MAIEPLDFLGSAALPSILNPPSPHVINDWEIDFCKPFVAINTFSDYQPTKTLSSITKWKGAAITFLSINRPTIFQ